MKVILREDVKHLGTVGEIVEVKPGYARNFLLPNRLVEIATPAAIKNWELGAERRQKKIEAELAKAKERGGTKGASAGQRGIGSCRLDCGEKSVCQCAVF